jgi:hypothetical protein
MRKIIKNAKYLTGANRRPIKNDSIMSIQNDSASSDELSNGYADKEFKLVQEYGESILRNVMSRVSVECGPILLTATPV